MKYADLKNYIVLWLEIELADNDTEFSEKACLYENMDTGEIFIKDAFEDEKLVKMSIVVAPLTREQPV